MIDRIIFGWIGFLSPTSCQVRTRFCFDSNRFVKFSRFSVQIYPLKTSTQKDCIFFRVFLLLRYRRWTTEKQCFTSLSLSGNHNDRANICHPVPSWHRSIRPSIHPFWFETLICSINHMIEWVTGWAGSSVLLSLWSISLFVSCSLEKCILTYWLIAVQVGRVRYGLDLLVCRDTLWSIFACQQDQMKTQVQFLVCTGSAAGNPWKLTRAWSNIDKMKRYWNIRQRDLFK